MNKEEMEDKLKGICQDCMWLEKIEPIFNQLLQENKQLKEIWDKLKKLIKECYIKSYSAEVHFVLDGILNEMQKFENGGK